MLVVGCLVALAASGASGGEARSQPVVSGVPRLSGTILQPDLADRWSDQQWAAELEYMQAVGIHTLVLQWTADSGRRTAVYPTGLEGYTQSTQRDVVGRLLGFADRAGIEVYLGLQVDSQWWSRYSADGRWLLEQAAIASRLATDLYERYSHHPSWTGWYLPFEVDNWNHRTREHWQNLARFYQEVTGHLRRLSADKPVMVSPFFNASGGQSTSQWRAMWEAILESSPLDVIALQDGVGAGHAAVDDLPAWFKATREAIERARPSTQLWAVTETFTPDFHTMPVRSVVENMRAVEPYVSRYLSFSFNHYLSPQQVPPAYFDAYQRYVSTGDLDTSPPSAPQGVVAWARDAITIEVAWEPAGDDIGVAGYELYRDGQPVRLLPGEVQGYLDGQLEPGRTYVYSIRAFDGTGNRSEPSAAVRVVTPEMPPYMTNLARGKPYTASLPAHSDYPDAGGELTDGRAASPSFRDPAWQGRLTGDVYTLTIDLGRVEAIGAISSSWLQDRSVFVLLPRRVTYSVSRDGQTFTPVGTVVSPAVSEQTQVKKYRVLALEGVSGRYVRVEVEPIGVSWTFVDEVDVWR